MSEKASPPVHNVAQGEGPLASQAQSSSTVPTHKVRIRTVYAGLCYVLAVLLVSLLTYLYVARLVSIVSAIGAIVLVVFTCLVTIAYYLIQTRYTVVSRNELFCHLRKLLLSVILISSLICISIIESFWVWFMLHADYGIPPEAILIPLVAVIVSLILLFFAFKKARSLAGQIPAAPGKKLAGVILLLLVLPACVTAITYNPVNNLILERQNQSYINSKLWTFVPTSSTHPLSLMDRIVFPGDGIWYFDENDYIAYYDFKQKTKTFISTASYSYEAYKGVSEEVYGDYFIFRFTASSNTMGGQEEYTIFNNKRKGTVRVVIPRPSQVYYSNGNRHTVLPTDSYALRSRDWFKNGKDKDTILVEVPVSINQREGYNQYIEIDLISGKITEIDEQDYNDAKHLYNTIDRPLSIHRRYEIDYPGGNDFYVIDNETGAKVKQPSRSAYCKISGGENYLICDTEDLEWWPDKSKKGFVYWSLPELIK
ncbi:MAG TPA: hypothetical protein PLC05_00860 [bacterium]|nr:hypothetical protein [bacterium]